MVTATPSGGMVLFLLVALLAGAAAVGAFNNRAACASRAAPRAAPFSSLGALSAFVRDDGYNNLEESKLAGPQPREDRRGAFHSSLAGADLIPKGATGPGGAIISDPGAARDEVDASAYVLDGKSTDDILANYADRRHARSRRVLSQSNSPQRFEITRRLVERELRTAKVRGAWWESEQ